MAASEDKAPAEQILLSLGDIISEGRRVNRALDTIADRLSSIEERLGNIEERLTDFEVRHHRIEDLVSRVQETVTHSPLLLPDPGGDVPDSESPQQDQ